jgi:hypothetical protein
MTPKTITVDANMSFEDFVDAFNALQAEDRPVEDLLKVEPKVERPPWEFQRHDMTTHYKIVVSE